MAQFLKRKLEDVIIGVEDVFQLEPRVCNRAGSRLQLTILRSIIIREKTPF